MLELQRQPQADTRRKEADFAYGYKLAEAFEDIKYCTNIDMRRGYLRACNDSAYADTSAFLVSQGAQF